MPSALSLPLPVRRALSLLQEQAPGSFMVGGLVRDTLLHRDTNDLDIAVPPPSLALAPSLAREVGGVAVPLDRQMGILRVVLEAGGRRWFLDLSAIQGGDIRADLSRRDFTVDAMAVPLEFWGRPPGEWPLLDPFNGRGDLERRLIRAVGPTVFRDDPVRLLRGPRLCAQLGFALEGETEGLISAEASRLWESAPERIREELLKIFSSPNVGAHLEALDRLGLLTLLFPALGEGKGVGQPPEHFWDVFHHNLQTAAQVERVLSPRARAEDPALAPLPWAPQVEQHLARELAHGYPRATFLKLAGLLHDIAKPRTRTMEPGGRIRFLGHHTEGARMAGEALRRLRMAGRAVEAVARMVQQHLRPSQMAPPGQMPTPRAVYRYFRDLGDEAIDTLYLNLADYLAARGPRLDFQDWQRHCAVIGHILQGGLATPPHTLPKLVDGHDLIQVFGLEPGPLFRRLLDSVREAQAAGEVRTREEALALLARLLGEDIRKGAPNA